MLLTLHISPAIAICFRWLLATLADDAATALVINTSFSRHCRFARHYCYAGLLRYVSTVTRRHRYAEGLRRSTHWRSAEGHTTHYDTLRRRLATRVTLSPLSPHCCCRWMVTLRLLFWLPPLYYGHSHYRRYYYCHWVAAAVASLPPFIRYSPLILRFFHIRHIADVVFHGCRRHYVYAATLGWHIGCIAAAYAIAISFTPFRHYVGHRRYALPAVLLIVRHTVICWRATIHTYITPLHTHYI